MYKKVIKRIIDFILSLCGLIILSPVFIILCIWIKLDSKGPILFKQKRIGINKSNFNIYKFRTMYIDTPKDMPTHMLADPDQYITKAGHFLRKTSLDELPQIINILKGEMSCISRQRAPCERSSAPSLLIFSVKALWEVCQSRLSESLLSIVLRAWPAVCGALSLHCL